MSFFGKLFVRKTDAKIRPYFKHCDAVKYMQDKGMTFDYEIVKVISSKDEEKRFVILKDNRGTFRFVYQVLHCFDEDEWKYIGCSEETNPGVWQSWGRFAEVFDCLDTALGEIKATPEYKNNF